MSACLVDKLTGLQLSSIGLSYVVSLSLSLPSSPPPVCLFVCARTRAHACVSLWRLEESFYFFEVGTLSEPELVFGFGFVSELEA